MSDSIRTGGGSLQTGWSFTQVPNTILEDEKLGGMEKIVYVALCSFADRGGVAFPSTKRIGVRAGVSSRTVQRSIAALVAAGHLRVVPRKDERGDQTSNLYTLVERDRESPPLTESHDPPDRESPPPLTESHPNDIQEELELSNEAVVAFSKTGDPLEGDFTEWYRAYPKRGHRADAQRHYAKCRKNGATREQLLEAAEKFVQQMQDEERDAAHIMYADRFLGRGEHWREALEYEGVDDDPPWLLDGVVN